MRLHAVAYLNSPAAASFKMLQVLPFTRNSIQNRFGFTFESAIQVVSATTTLSPATAAPAKPLRSDVPTFSTK